MGTDIATAASPLVSVSNLATWFPSGSRWFGKARWLRAVDGVDLTVGAGEIVALVGESGSGKTTVGRSILRLVEPRAGLVQFAGINVRRLASRDLRALRRRMQIVFQDPYAALSPRRQIHQIIAEPLLLHGLASRDTVSARVAALLAEVGLEPYFMHRYPHEMSGGQRQRIAIARALAVEPEFIVADEPVSALDVSVRAQILSILLDLRRKRHIALMFISHDLSVVERLADRVAVMYRGKIVEQGETTDVIRRPLHPYTQRLIASVPAADPAVHRAPRRTVSHAPVAPAPPGGCAFASRCPEVDDSCRRITPTLEMKPSGHLAACHFR
ncbi:MAG: ABC transporter ATP-binding protein [Acidobacteriota bacterium]